jgi:hypothetical protein
MLLVPLAVLIVTPLLRPFRLSRLFWTYLGPVVPMLIPFDGLISCPRLYNLPELRDLTAGLIKHDYIGKQAQLEVGGC